jgi:hypothetical protein
MKYNAALQMTGFSKRQNNNCMFGREAKIKHAQKSHGYPITAASLGVSV